MIFGCTNHCHFLVTWDILRDATATSCRRCGLVATHFLPEIDYINSTLQACSLEDRLVRPIQEVSKDVLHRTGPSTDKHSTCYQAELRPARRRCSRSSVRLFLYSMTATYLTFIYRKANRLEIYTQTSEGFTLLASKTVYGYITMLERLRPASAATDYLFVGTDRYQYFTCSWDAEKKHLVTQQSYVDVADKQLRDSREMDRCNIDSTSRYMTLELYDGVVTVVPITQPQQGPKKQRMDRPAGSLGEPVQVRVEEMMTRDSAFVHSTDPKQSPQLAILWEDNSEVPQLKIRELKFYPESAGDPASAEMKTVAELRADLHLGVSHLIPVPSPLGGFLILGERAIYYSDSGLNDLLQQDLDDDATIWTCWTKVDDHRWLLADDYGHLFFLMISTRNGAVNGWKLEAVGTASKASCLIYLDEGYVFVGSHSGNSQIVKIVPGGVEVLQEFDNIAPILDFSIMDLGRGAEGPQATEFSTGQARLVTASGAWQDGSIRSVRSGVGMEELGTVGEFDHITDLWSLNTTVTDQFDDILVTAFAEQTRVFRFDASGAVEEVPDFNGFELQETTLLAVNLPDRKLLQIHESGVRIADQDSGMLISQWKPSDGGATITAASANSVHILVVESGHTLHLFHISNDLTPTVSKTFTSDSQISGVTLPHSRSSSCIISFWQSASVAILDLHSLETIAVQTLGEPGIAIPRALVVADVLPDSPPTLFIAMADGTVVTYNFDITKNSLNGMTRILLGTEPVFFKLLPRDPYAPGNGTGLSNIFASCEQPCLIYASEGRIVYSAVNSDKASRVCQFNNEGFPAAIAIATPTELKLAVIGTERTTQIQTLPVQETVRCLAYEPRINLFGMGCVRRILEKGQEALMSCVKIADEVSFQELDSYELEDNELVECIISTGPLDAELEDLGFEEMFVVGTSLLHEVVIDGEDVVKGRILVFEANKEKKLSLLASRYVKGACRSLGMCDGKIVAGLVKTVSCNNGTDRNALTFPGGGLLFAAIYANLVSSINHQQDRRLPDIDKSIGPCRYTCYFDFSGHHRRGRSYEIPLNRFIITTWHQT